MSLEEKRKSYEAMCLPSVSSGAAPKVARGKNSAVAERMRQRFGGRTPQDSTKMSFPKRKLTNITEQRVLKTGVRQLHKEFVVTQGANIMDLPKRPDGSSKVMQASFFERLLSDRIEIKGSLESDVAAAQLDVRYLSMEQLLAVRSGTLDFLTESEKHSAHNNFLNTVDLHLFEKITQRCLQRCGELNALSVRSQALHAAGLRLALTLGAVDVLTNGWDVKQKQDEAPEPVPSVPCCWVVRLDENLWQGYRFAVFNTVAMTFKVASTSVDFSTAVPAEERLAVVLDRSSGSGPTRMMHWEVALLDPHTCGEEIVAEIDRRSSCAVTTTSRKLSTDLEEAVRKVRSRGSGSSELAEAMQKIRSRGSSDVSEVSPKEEKSVASGTSSQIGGSTPSPSKLSSSCSPLGPAEKNPHSWESATESQRRAADSPREVALATAVEAAEVPVAADVPQPVVAAIAVEIAEPPVAAEALTPVAAATTVELAEPPVAAEALTPVATATAVEAAEVPEAAEAFVAGNSLHNPSPTRCAISISSVTTAPADAVDASVVTALAEAVDAAVAAEPLELGSKLEARIDDSVAKDASDAPVPDESDTAQVADESEEGVSPLARERAVALNGKTTEGRSVAEIVAPESQVLMKPQRPSCFAGCFGFARPAR